MLVVGPSHAQGGIASVMRLYRHTTLWQTMGCRELSTYVEGSRLAKAVAALKAYVRAPGMIARSHLVHVHLSAASSCTRKLPIVALARMLGKPVLIHVHAATMASITDHPLSWPALRTLRMATRVVALSDAWAAALRPLLGHIPIAVLPNPVSAIGAMNRMDSQSDAPTILFAGRLEARKGYDDLLRATQGLAAQFPDVQVWLAGDGEVDRAERRARELGIASTVRVMGWVGAEAVTELLRAATVFCLPSYGEGMPMSVLEAMNYSLPVVTTPVGGLPELIHDGVNGLFVSPGDVVALQDRLRVLLEDADLRQRLGSAGKRSVDRACGLHAMAHRMEALYLEMLHSSTVATARTEPASMTGGPGMPDLPYER